jgi:hypothetical protein
LYLHVHFTRLFTLTQYTFQRGSIHLWYLSSGLYKSTFHHGSVPIPFVGALYTYLSSGFCYTYLRLGSINLPFFCVLYTYLSSVIYTLTYYQLSIPLPFYQWSIPLPFFWVLYIYLSSGLNKVMRLLLWIVNHECVIINADTFFVLKKDRVKIKPFITALYTYLSPSWFYKFTFIRALYIHLSSGLNKVRRLVLWIVYHQCVIINADTFSCKKKKIGSKKPFITALYTSSVGSIKLLSYGLYTLPFSSALYSHQFSLVYTYFRPFINVLSFN